MSDEIKDEKPVIPLPEDLAVPPVVEQSRIENVYGTLLRVTTTPTWTPRSFYEGFAIDTTNLRFYWYDFVVNAWKFTQGGATVAAILNGLLPSQTSNSGKVLTTNGSDASWGGVSQIIVNVLAGEHLTAGEVVRVYDSNTEHGYGQTTSPATAYVARASGKSAAFTDYVLGIALSTTNYLSSCPVLVAGASTVQSGLTLGKNYLADYSATSTETITQSDHTLAVDFSDTAIITQIWIPTSSFLDKVKFYLGFSASVTPRLRVKRASTVLVTAYVDSNVGNVYLFLCGGIKTYKGELLTFVIDSIGTPGDKGQIYYNTGDLYHPTYDPTGSSASIDATGGTLPASGADLYMSVFEYTGFGALATTAGTRPIKIGNALSATSLALALQEKDNIL